MYIMCGATVNLIYQVHALKRRNYNEIMNVLFDGIKMK